MHQGTKRLYRDIDSPIGPLRLVGSGDSLHYLVILKAQQPKDNMGELIEDSSSFGSIVEQLNAYFDNEMWVDDLFMDIHANTDNKDSSCITNTNGDCILFFFFLY